MNKILIPEDMIQILSDYVKSVLEDKPADLLEWSTKYFENENKDYARIFLKHNALDSDVRLDLTSVLSLYRNEELQNHICSGEHSTSKDYLRAILDYQFYPKKIEIEDYLNQNK
eukprot:NODE_74_length_24438_cov_0.900283.p15 type:complete len:114 gc:universal NODE_74_length_24438_cov_0.900283:20409-20750(+)